MIIDVVPNFFWFWIISRIGIRVRLRNDVRVVIEVFFRYAPQSLRDYRFSPPVYGSNGRKAWVI